MRGRREGEYTSGPTARTHRPHSGYRLPARGAIAISPGVFLPLKIKRPRPWNRADAINIVISIAFETHDRDRLRVLDCARHSVVNENATQRGTSYGA